jgi:hypothetical protein
MLTTLRQNARSVALEQRLRAAKALTPDLISAVISQKCTRLPALNARVKAKVTHLVDVGAWTDAALTLLELELPQWKVRRLVWEDGVWLCSLSKQPWMPLDFDDLAEASHASLPVAILLALFEARSAPSSVTPVTAPSVRPAPGYAMCCDNFA